MAKKPNLVFFLGAGFSKSFDQRLPTGDTMLRAVLTKAEEISPGGEKLIKRVIGDIFSKSLIIDYSRKRVPIDFELFLGILYGLRHKEDDSKLVLGSVDPNTVWQLVVASVGRAIRYEHVGYENSQKGDLGHLIAVLKHCKKHCASVSIVTTNYDLISDKAVQWQHDRFLGYTDLTQPAKDCARFQYGVRVRGIWEMRGRKSVFDHDYKAWRKISGIPIYKLHGSMNWAYCESCKELDLSATRYDVAEIFDIAKKAVCAKKTCQKPYDWLLVPPTTTKDYDNPVLKEVWCRAEAALAQAQRVVFIGYSLPPPDPLVAQMILRARAKSKKKYGHPWQYLVFDPCPDVHKRFKTLFGRPERRTWHRDFDISVFRQRWKKEKCEV